MSNLLRNLLIALALAAVLYLGYTLVLSDKEIPLITSDHSVEGQGAIQTRDFLARIQSLKSVEIDNEFFDDRRFTSLVDFGVTLTPEPTGRSNPFAPVE